MQKKRPPDVRDGYLVRKAVGYGRWAKYSVENARRQKAQLDHARAWGWKEKRIEYVDEGAGRSGAITNRPGLQRLLRTVTAN